MPYVEGGSLRQRLQREVQLPIDEAMRIAREVAGALEHSHRHGIVHRDIKPENILLSGGRVLLADFGIAKLFDAGDAAKLTETGLALGTPAYMSPEQAPVDPRLDARTDVYSLGCVLYEMLAGQPPFTGPTAQAIDGAACSRADAVAPPGAHHRISETGVGGLQGGRQGPGRPVRDCRRVCRRTLGGCRHGRHLGECSSVGSLDSPSPGSWQPRSCSRQVRARPAGACFVVVGPQ